MSRVGCVIVTYNSAATLQRAAASFLNSRLAATLVIVDNASSDESAEYAKVLTRHAILNGMNTGFARAVNRGLGLVTEEYVLLLNPDAELMRGSLEKMVCFLDSHPAACMCGPALISPDGSRHTGARKFSTIAGRSLPMIPLFGRLKWSRSDEYPSVESMAAKKVDYVWGAAMLVRRAFLEELGGLDERFFIYSEDEDLGRAAQAAGFACYLIPSAQVVHIGGASCGDGMVSYVRQLLGVRLLFDKWGGSLLGGLFTCVMLTVCAIRAGSALPLSDRARDERRRFRLARRALLGGDWLIGEERS